MAVLLLKQLLLDGLTSGGARIFRLPGHSQAPELGVGHTSKNYAFVPFIVGASSYTARTNGSSLHMVGKSYIEKMIDRNLQKTMSEKKPFVVNLGNGCAGNHLLA